MKGIIRMDVDSVPLDVDVCMQLLGLGPSCEAAPPHTEPNPWHGNSKAGAAGAGAAALHTCDRG